MTIYDILQITIRALEIGHRAKHFE